MLLLRVEDTTDQNTATGETTHQASYTERTMAIRHRPSLTCERAHYHFLAIHEVRFFLRELHSVVGENWGGLVWLTLNCDATCSGGDRF
jgi:hypothetical protein